MAAEISFWGDQDGLTTQFAGSYGAVEPGSGLGFFGATFGASVQVGEHPDSTFIASADGASEGPEANNCKYNGDVSGVLWNGSGDAVHVNTIPNESGTLKISFTYDSTVKPRTGFAPFTTGSARTTTPAGSPATWPSWSTRRTQAWARSPVRV